MNDQFEQALNQLVEEKDINKEELLKMIEENGGSIEVVLNPIRSRTGEGTDQRKRKKQNRAQSTRHLGTGAKRRFAVAQLGGVPSK